MKFIRIFLAVLIVIGIGLLFTQKMWVPKLVDVIMKHELVQVPIALPLPIPPKVSPTPYGDVTLKAGETVKFPGSSLSLVRVFDDSRCPKGVTCIWAGTVKAEINIITGSNATTSVVELGKSITISGEEISLLSVEPYPEKDKKINTQEYRLIFHVAKK